MSLRYKSTSPSAVSSQSLPNSKVSDTISISSSVSAFSTGPDRHGFYGGTQFTDKPKVPLSKAQIIAREKKWLHMLDHWSEYMSKNYKKIRERCRKGIPSAVRPKAWFYLSGGQSLLEAHPNVYHELLEQDGDAQIIDEIKRDQNRQFPMHEMFLDEDRPGQKELFNILKAYSILNPQTGYCQAQAPIAAFLLMHLPAEQAFWAFVSICDKYLKDYFTPGMEMLRRDAKLFMALLKRTSPQAHRHLVKTKVEPLMFMADWFLCAMTRTLKWDCLLRVWDCFLCEGIKIIFKVALVIVSATLEPHKVRKNNKELCDVLGLLKTPKEEFIEEDFMMHHIMRINITVQDFIVEHKKVEMQIRKEQAQNLM